MSESLPTRVYDQLMTDGHRALADEYAEANGAAEGRTLYVTAKPLEPGHMLGLRSGWVNGTSDELGFDLDSGAGFGSTGLSMSVTFADGTRVTEIITITELAKQWADALLADHKKGI